MLMLMLFIILITNDHWFINGSVNIAMYMLYNNIVSDTFHSDVCVDFLGTHMISLVLFFRKPSVTCIQAKDRPHYSSL
jgi:hypothetical protein